MPKTWVTLAGIWRSSGSTDFSVMAYDYSGYGTSGGKPSERAARLNAEAAYDYLVRKRGIAPERIIIWGRSVGSGPSVHLAATRRGGWAGDRERLHQRLPRDDPGPPAAVRPLRQPAGPWSRSPAPCWSSTARSDEIIPFRHGRQLFEKAPAPKMHLWVERAGHNDLVEVAGPAYWDAAQRFARMLENGSGHGRH